MMIYIYETNKSVTSLTNKLISSDRITYEN